MKCNQSSINCWEGLYKGSCSSAKHSTLELVGVPALFRYNMAQNNEKEVKKCSLCHYTSTHTGKFNYHKRIHTGEKPFKRNQCDYAASQAAQLKFHIMRHNGETPFKCNQCSFSAVREGDVKNTQQENTLNFQWNVTSVNILPRMLNIWRLAN